MTANNIGILFFYRFFFTDYPYMSNVNIFGLVRFINWVKFTVEWKLLSSTRRPNGYIVYSIWERHSDRENASSKLQRRSSARQSRSSALRTKYNGPSIAQSHTDVFVKYFRLLFRSFQRDKAVFRNVSTRVNILAIGK